MRLTVVAVAPTVEVRRATTGEFLVVHGQRIILDGTFSRAADAIAKAREINGDDYQPVKVARIEAAP